MACERLIQLPQGSAALHPVPCINKKPAVSGLFIYIDWNWYLAKYPRPDSNRYVLADNRF